MGREQQLAEALVGLADSFADDIDPVVLADRIDVPDLEGSADRWPVMAPFAVRCSYRALEDLHRRALLS
ncbi:hypothetical protein [Streptomyces echinatus]|uniref:hypothetical protein n=1 Tax=Streptomyces echinatus TaxID=67293 RepID=UPI0037A0C469